VEFNPQEEPTQPEKPSGGLAGIWPEIEKLIFNGYSLIPVRERADTGHPAKSPYSGWKQWQHQRATVQQLWNAMDKNYTTAVAMICGAISGNVEVIDIDNKNKPGIETSLFNDIRTLFPDLFNKLRIHRSPSGGFHIIYKVNVAIPGNKKLASRNSTEDEIKAGQARVKNFLETRGEGGYVLVPPSGGYTVVQDKEPPILTWDERTMLIALCEGYNEIKQPSEENRGRPNKADTDYYITGHNPFDDFNLSAEAETVLQPHGWKIYNQNNQFIWYTRPGTVRGGIHAAFLKDRRLYYFFTTNTEFDSERCYQPATVFSTLEHGGDKKITYTKLVEKGYGKIRPDREQKIVNTAIVTGSAVPSNLSAGGVAAVEAGRSRLNSIYPYGIFWTAQEEVGDSIAIERERLYEVSSGLGFRYDAATADVVQLKDNLIYPVTDRYYFDTMKGYIKEEGLLRYEISNAYESFVQKAGNFSMSRLELLNEDMILNDTRDVCFKFYEDVFIRITKDGYTEHDYSEMQGYIIWATQIQKRKLRIGDGGRYVDFLNKAIEYDQKPKYIDCLLGYLSHNYRDETTGFIPVLVEQCEDPRHGGGSGKNLFCNLLRLTTTVLTTNGSGWEYDEKALQIWNGERVYVINDVDQQFNFVQLKDPSTNDGKLKKLFKNQTMVPTRRMPKFVVLTNYSYEINDGGLNRRVRPLEFTDYFTRVGGVDIEYGIYFPHGWTEEDWAGYDTTIINAVQAWLKNELKIPENKLTESGWRKQMEHSYGTTIMTLIDEHWNIWLDMKVVKNDEFKNQLTVYYEERGISKTYQPSSFKINRAIQAYADHFGLHYNPNFNKKENGIQMKCRLFGAPF